MTAAASQRPLPLVKRLAAQPPTPTATGRAQGPQRASSATGRGQVRNAAAAAGGLLVDQVLGEPPAVVHPVATFGRAMAALEGRIWRDCRLAGLGYAATGVGLGAAAGFALGSSIPAGTVATWAVVAGRALGEEARAVGE